MGASNSKKILQKFVQIYDLFFVDHYNVINESIEHV